MPHAQARQMEHRVHTTHRVLAGRSVHNVALDNLQRPIGRTSEVLAAASPKIVEHHDMSANVQQVLDEVRANEASTTRHKDFFRGHHALKPRSINCAFSIRMFDSLLTRSNSRQRDREADAHVSHRGNEPPSLRSNGGAGPGRAAQLPGATALRFEAWPWRHHFDVPVRSSPRATRTRPLQLFRKAAGAREFPKPAS